MEQPEQKPKRPQSEEKLRILAENRLKGLATRAKKKEIKQAIKAQEREKLEKDYEEKVLKKKQTPKQAPPPEQVVEVEEEGSESESETEEVAPPPPVEPNYKQLYYRKKVALLEQYEQQAQAPPAYHYQQPSVGQYQYQGIQQASPMAHAEQIARATLKKKADEVIQAQAYRSIFPA